MTLTADVAFAELRDAVVIVCEVDGGSLSRETRLEDDLHADSLAMVEIVDIAEAALRPRAHTGFGFDDAQLDNLGTLGAMADHAVAVDAALGKR